MAGEKGNVAPLGTVTVRRARKEHRCIDCCDPIPKDSRYADVKTGTAKTDRFCWRCAEGQGLVTAADSPGHRACPWCGSGRIEFTGPETDLVTQVTKATILCHTCQLGTTIVSENIREHYAAGLIGLLRSM